MALRAFFNSVISGTAPFRTYVLVGFSVVALTASLGRFRSTSFSAYGLQISTQSCVAA